MPSDTPGTLRPPRPRRPAYHALYAATLGYMTTVALQHVVLLVAAFLIPIHLFRRSILLLSARTVSWLARRIRPYFYNALFDAIGGIFAIMDTVNGISVQVDGAEVKTTAIELLKDMLDTFERMSIIMEYLAEGRLEESIRKVRG